MTTTLIIKRGSHYEVHYVDRVEFWSLDLQTKLDTLKTHQNKIISERDE